jgi:ABC-2 type transport system ATP-binding protein
MGITVLMSGHLLGDIVQLCSHVAILRQGHLIRSAPVEELVGGTSSAGQRIEVEVVLGEELARAALERMTDVADLQADGRVISFTFRGDQASLATLVDELVEGGVQLSRFGPGPERYDEMAAVLVDNSKVVG